MLCFSFAATLGLVAAALPASAQDDLSVDDLVGLWDKQKDLFREAQTNGLGKTRGLEIITIDEPARDAAQPGAGASVAVAPTTADATDAPTDPNRPLTSAAGTTVAASAAVQPMLVGQLAPELQVNLQINFGFDSAALAENEKPKMQKICQAMKQSDVQVFRIIGHTDTAGSDEYNQKLSLLRANEVKRFLVDDCGIGAARLDPVGMGERLPFNAENTRADENRRVEFQALS
ncbi:OmpA family protein [Paracoccus marinaquae]|nr:OmpA family protein [Paracoccus marinaquae]